MDLPTAKSSFMQLLDNTSPKAVAELLHWITDSFAVESNRPEGAEEGGEAKASLIAIAQELRAKLPTSALVASEAIRWPTEASNEYPESSTVHVDAFLYDDDDVELLSSQGLLPRSFCKGCGSKDTSPLTFISHSLSQRALRFIFTALLPPMEMVGKTVLDVGSRLGCVLYAGLLYSPHAKFFGVEMNRELATLTAETLQKWGLGDRGAVACQDLRQSQNLVVSANVVVLHNVFQFFLPPQEQAECWLYLKQQVVPGTLILSSPALPEQQLPFDATTWVTELPSQDKAAKYAGSDEELFEELSNLHLYRVNQI